MAKRSLDIAEDVVIIFSQPLTQNNGIKSSQQSQDAFNSYKLNTPLFEAVKSDDIEFQKKKISSLEDELKREKKREEGRKKFNALTYEERYTLREARNKKEKEFILRRYDLK